MSLLPRLKAELGDPWGLLVGGLSGGMAWAVLASVTPAALPVGLGVGAAVLGVKAVSGLLLDRSSSDDDDDDDAPDRLRRPPPGSEAGLWLARAETALGGLRRLSAPRPLRPAVQRAVDDAGETVGVLARLGGQVAALEDVLRRLDPRALTAEAADLARRRASSSPDVQADLARSAAAVADRLAVHQRLLDARTTLLARMQAVALGLEGLETRLLELVALSGVGSGLEDPSGQVAALAGELEGLRAGLVEAEALSRGALAAGPGRPGAA
ncbi:MAG: hypothetical protein JWN17_13 [Frankiales bacterium]|nr:hypothetical protein [Frankiales bacterium]